MSDVMIKTSERVKTLSIIDTISELAKNENEASRLTLPSPISNHHQNSPINKSLRKHSTPNKSKVSQVLPFQNGNNGPNSHEVQASSVSKTNDVKSGQHSIYPPPLISPPVNGAKLKPMAPNFTLYEIDQKQNPVFQDKQKRI